LLEELLTTQGFKVIAVPDGAAALEELTRVQADLVLLDVMMPRMNGFEACEKIKSNPDTYLIPVIMITPGQSARARGYGVCHAGRPGTYPEFGLQWLSLETDQCKITG
jgi:CheY-like chemotaxis protein